MKRRTLLIALASSLPARWALAQGEPAAFPQRPIQLIVPYPPGGNADGVARLFGEAFGGVAGKPVIVDNKPGASGTIGAGAVVRAPADGHTLLLTPSSQLHNTLLEFKPPYDAARDFAPIIGLTVNPLILGVSTSLKVNTLQEFAQKVQGGGIAYGSFGIGNVTHVLLHVLNQQMNGKMLHVPYAGENPVMNAMLGGHVHAGLYSPGFIREMEQAGKVRPLATLGVKRSAFLPHVPTFAEQGFKQLDWPFSSVIYASAKTPAPLLARLEQLARQAVTPKAVQDAFQSRGSEFWGGSSAEMRAQIANTSQHWPQMVAGLGKLA